jgi:hypothetical protein
MKELSECQIPASQDMPNLVKDKRYTIVHTGGFVV